MASALFLLLLLAGAVLSGPPDVEHGGRGEEAELVGFTTCAGCPGGNVESVPEEMIRNGAQAIHLATGLVVGYPPCPHLDDLVAGMD